jgi:hypothetical protein
VAAGDKGVDLYEIKVEGIEINVIMSTFILY